MSPRGLSPAENGHLSARRDISLALKSKIPKPLLKMYRDLRAELFSIGFPRAAQFTQPAGESDASIDSGLAGDVEVGQRTYYDPKGVRFITWIPGERIVIGKYCSIANGVTIFSGGGHRTDSVSTYPFDNFFFGRKNPTRTYQTTGKTVVGNDVWIGYGAHISGGVQIGHGAVIGTRAAVFSDVPSYGIVVGNPARLVRYRFSRPLVERLLRIAWWDWPEDTVRENLEWFYRPIGEFVARFDPGEDSLSQHSLRPDGRADRAH
jgi:virginiamycin A acetyltransferase